MKKSRWILVIIMLIFVVAGGYWHYIYSPNLSAQRAEKSLLMTPVQKGDIEDIVTAQGTLEPKSFVDLGVQVSGQLKKVLVSIGDNVNAGDLIAEIDPMPYEARVQVDKARIHDLHAQIAQQQANLEKSLRDFNLNKSLNKRHVISEQVLLDSETLVKVSKAQVQSLQAQLEGAEATLKGDIVNLGYTKIFTPIKGTVVIQDPREGQTLNASQMAPVVARIANLDVLTARAQVAEADIMKLRVGMPAYFTTLGDPDVKWHGKIRLIQPSPEVINQVVLYDVLVDVDNQKRKLATGMSVQAFFVVAQAKDVLVIPVSALGKRDRKEDSGNGLAYHVNTYKDQKVTDQVIHVGLMNRKLVEVRDGLKLHEQVLLNASMYKSGSNNRPRFTHGPRL
jgi:macrolide-specific efflux system membrane fusion protein